MTIWSRIGAVEISGLHGLLLALAMGLQAPVHAADLTESPKQWTLAIGVLAHDSGPFSDHHENGVDLNLEAQFAPLNVLGSPRPHLGVAANFQGDTSVAYAGLGFRLRETTQYFVDGILGVALHDGPLHKDPVGCQLYSDCGYGTRFLPRFGLEIGYRVSPVASVSILFDHMSHKWLVAGENEGLDHVGLRYLRAY
jgi:lipid A 3-O-deacylase